MSDSRIELKNPWFAAVLAYLIPGAGHLYQGRIFKGVLYLVCILGAFFYGSHMAEGKAVYYPVSQNPGKRTYGFYAQVGIGLPAIVAYVQAKRYTNPTNGQTNRLDESFSAPFEGRISRYPLEGDNVVDDLAGQITLEPVDGQFGNEVRGTFSGTVNGNEPVEFELTGPITFGPEISAKKRRSLSCYVDGNQEGDFRAEPESEITGGIPRSFWNHFEVPVDDRELERLYGDLGKRYELALVFTWIAGLLNLLAVWDALEGPAYGYGDEETTRDPSRTDGEDAEPSPNS